MALAAKVDAVAQAQNQVDDDGPHIDITGDTVIQVAKVGDGFALSANLPGTPGLRYAVAQAAWSGPGNLLAVKDIGPLLNSSGAPVGSVGPQYSVAVLGSGAIKSGDVLEVTELVETVSGTNYPVVYSTPAPTTFGVVTNGWTGEVTVSVSINGGATTTVPLTLMGGGSRPNIAVNDLVLIIAGTAYVASDPTPVGSINFNVFGLMPNPSPWWKQLVGSAAISVLNAANASNGSNAAACPSFGPTMDGVVLNDLGGYLLGFSTAFAQTIEGDPTGSTTELNATVSRVAVGTGGLATVISQLASHGNVIETTSTTGASFHLPIARMGMMIKVA